LNLVIHKKSTPRSGKAWWATAVFDGGLLRALRALGAPVGAVKALIGRYYAQRPQNRGSHNNPKRRGSSARGCRCCSLQAGEAGADTQTFRRLHANRRDAPLQRPPSGRRPHPFVGPLVHPRLASSFHPAHVHHRRYRHREPR